jgi:hypothetical protein
VLPGRMRAVGSTMVVVVHFAGSVATLVAASEHWVSASRIVVVASEVEGAAFALPLVAGSSAVA